MTDITTKPRGARKAVGKPAADPAVKTVIDAFYAAFVRRFNPSGRAEAWLGDMASPGYLKRPRSVPREQMTLPLIRGAKDGDLVRKMLAAWGAERVLDLVARFFEQSRRGLPPAVNSAHDIGALWIAAPRLLVGGELARESGTMDGRMAGNADAVRRAMGKT